MINEIRLEIANYAADEFANAKQKMQNKPLIRFSFFSKFQYFIIKINK